MKIRRFDYFWRFYFCLEWIDDRDNLWQRSNPINIKRFNDRHTRNTISVKDAPQLHIKYTHWNLIAPRKSSPLFHVTVWLNLGVELVCVTVFWNLPRQSKTLTSSAASKVPMGLAGWMIVRGWIRKPLNSVGLVIVTCIELPRWITFVSTCTVTGDGEGCGVEPWAGVKVKQTASVAPSGYADRLAMKTERKITRSFMFERLENTETKKRWKSAFCNQKTTSKNVLDKRLWISNSDQKCQIIVVSAKQYILFKFISVLQKKIQPHRMETKSP